MRIKGKTKATLAGDRLHARSASRVNWTSILVAIAFLTATGVSALIGRIPLLIPGAYVVFSLITSVVYAIDKSAAQRGDRRTPEVTLHLMALAGGWPGALIAQQTLRHKSRKPSFRIAFWITVLVNCAVFAWFHTEGGSSFLAQLAQAA